jgi:hypothetical protein
VSTRPPTDRQADLDFLLAGLEQEFEDGMRRYVAAKGHPNNAARYR